MKHVDRINDSIRYTRRALPNVYSRQLSLHHIFQLLAAPGMHVHVSHMHTHTHTHLGLASILYTGMLSLPLIQDNYCSNTVTVSVHTYLLVSGVTV